MAEPRVIYEGSTEDLTVTVSAEEDLGEQSVSFSLDSGSTWIDATWDGATAAKVRSASAEVDGDSLPTFPFDVQMLVKVGDTIKVCENRRVIGRSL